MCSLFEAWGKPATKVRESNIHQRDIICHCVSCCQYVSLPGPLHSHSQMMTLLLLLLLGMTQVHCTTGLVIWLASWLTMWNTETYQQPASEHSLLGDIHQQPTALNHYLTHFTQQHPLIIPVLSHAWLYLRWTYYAVFPVAGCITHCNPSVHLSVCPVSARNSRTKSSRKPQN